MELFMVNPSTMLVVENISSIELHPTGSGVVFMTNGKAYSINVDKAAELIETLRAAKSDYDEYEGGYN